MLPGRIGIFGKLKCIDPVLICSELVQVTQKLPQGIDYRLYSMGDMTFISWAIYSPYIDWAFYWESNWLWQMGMEYVNGMKNLKVPWKIGLLHNAFGWLWLTITNISLIWMSFNNLWEINIFNFVCSHHLKIHTSIHETHSNRLVCNGF